MVGEGGDGGGGGYGGRGAVVVDRLGCAAGTPVLNVKVRAAVCVGAYTRVIDRVERSLVRLLARSLARSSPLALPGCLHAGPPAPT